MSLLLVLQGKFTRVSIELDLTKPLISKFGFDDRIHHMEYEGLHVICFECDKFSIVVESIAHESEHPKHTETAESSCTSNDMDVPNEPVKPELENKFGSWMLAKAAPRLHQKNFSAASTRPQEAPILKKPVNQGPSKEKFGSKFDVITNMENISSAGTVGNKGSNKGISSEDVTITKEVSYLEPQQSNSSRKAYHLTKRLTIMTNTMT